MPETTPTGVSPSPELDSEDQLQSLYDAGAFEPDEPPKADDPPEDIAAEPPEEPAYSSLDEFLSAQKIDPQSVRALPVQVKVDGETKLVPLSDVLKSYQLEGHVNNKSMELSNQQKQFEQERQAARELMRQQVQHNAALGQLAVEQLNADFQRIDWNALRQTNPAEYAALQADFQSRQQSIQQYLAQVGQQQQHVGQQDQHAFQQTLQAERQRLLEKVPEWQSEEKFAAARDEMTKYAKTLGFSDAELNQVVDHRILMVLKDAASYASLQASKPEALKRVREAPKMAKPGVRNETNPKQSQRQAAIERFNRNPRDIDAQAAMFSALLDD